MLIVEFFLILLFECLLFLIDFFKIVFDKLVFWEFVFKRRLNKLDVFRVVFCFWWFLIRFCNRLWEFWLCVIVFSFIIKFLFLFCILMVFELMFFRRFKIFDLFIVSDWECWCRFFGIDVFKNFLEFIFFFYSVFEGCIEVVFWFFGWNLFKVVKWKVVFLVVIRVFWFVFWILGEVEFLLMKSRMDGLLFNKV